MVCERMEVVELVRDDHWLTVSYDDIDETVVMTLMNRDT
jgi:hypothetical protein